MKKRTNKKPPTVAPGAAKEKTNTRNPTTCRPKQQTLFDAYPEPERGEGPVELYLRTRPGWHDRGAVAIALSLSEREVRAQAENSGGLIIFSSQRGRGLRHSFNADIWEMNACQAELRNRATSHLRRDYEIELVKQQRRASR